MRTQRSAAVPSRTLQAPASPAARGAAGLPFAIAPPSRSLLCVDLRAGGRTQQGDHGTHDGIHVAGDHDRPLIGLRRLQVPQLAIEELRGKEVLQAYGKAPLKFF